ncbi:MAG: hypothetical protein M1825_004464 [Sarcosagium campestre]|nr:MAG: hypothetical protein M1825_004464 [Sarcosagium campestre]
MGEKRRSNGEMRGRDSGSAEKKQKTQSDLAHSLPNYRIPDHPNSFPSSRSPVRTPQSADSTLNKTSAQTYGDFGKSEVVTRKVNTLVSALLDILEDQESHEAIVASLESSRSKWDGKLLHLMDTISSSISRSAPKTSPSISNIFQNTPVAGAPLDKALPVDLNVPNPVAEGPQGGSNVATYLDVSRPLRTHLSLPPLPPVTDASLLEKIFTHQSYLRTEQSSLPDQSYEQSEFLGDAYVQCISSRLVCGRLAHLPVGRLSQVRETLVCNSTLAEYAVAYGFDKKLRIIDMSLMTGKNGLKIPADVFEAYVSGVVATHGFAVAEMWLTDLWAPRVLKHLRVPELVKSAKQDLAKRVMGRDIRLDYHTERPPMPIRNETGKLSYGIGVYITGWGWVKQHLGSGEGVSKSDAGTRAAMAALENRPLVDQISAIKREYDEKKQIERARLQKEWEQRQKNEQAEDLQQSPQKGVGATEQENGKSHPP